MKGMPLLLRYRSAGMERPVLRGSVEEDHRHVRFRRPADEERQTDR